MMNIKSIFRVVLYSVAIVAFWFTGCRKNNPDVTPPGINISYPTPSQQWPKVQVGKTFKFEATFTDDTELSQVKINIHHAFDQHGHEKNEVTKAWTVDTVISMNGIVKKLTVNLLIPINTATGPYHFELSALDTEGNETPTTSYYFDLYSTKQPYIENFQINYAIPSSFITEMSFNGFDTIRPTISATIKDTTFLYGLEKIYMSLRPSKNNLPIDTEPIAEYIVPMDTTTVYQYNLIKQFPIAKDKVTQTEYYFTLTVQTKDGNYSSRNQVFRIYKN